MWSAKRFANISLIFTRTDARTHVASRDRSTSVNVALRKNTCLHGRYGHCAMDLGGRCYAATVCPKGPWCHGRALPKRARVTEW